MKKLTLLVLVFIFALSGINTVMAKDPVPSSKKPGPREKIISLPSGEWWKQPQVVDKLSLTEKEQEKLDTIYLEHQYQIIDLHGQMKKERLGLEHLLNSAAFDANTGKDRFNKFLSARNEVDTERFNFLIQVRQLLGHERFLQLKTELQQLRMKRQSERRKAK